MFFYLVQGFILQLCVARERIESMKKAIIWWELGAVVLIGILVAAWAIWGNDLSSLKLQPLVQNEPFALSVFFPDGSPQAGKTQPIRLQVDREGKPFDLYGENYAIHLIVANPDFSSFLHTVDLEQKEIGIYGTDVLLGPAGAYRVWVEVSDAKAEQRHGKGAGMIGSAEFRVGGGSGSVQAQPRIYGKEAAAGPYTVALDHEELRAGVESEWRIQVKDAQGQVKQLLSPEPTIYVIIGPRLNKDLPFFRHGHTIPPRDGNTAVWRETFSEPGQYLLWTTIYTGTPGQPIEAVEIPFVLTVT